MEPTKKKRRGEWTENQLKAAIAAVQRGVSQRKAAAQFSIPRRTLRNHIKSGSLKKTTGRIPVLSDKQEKDLVSRIIRLAHVGIPLTPKIVRKQAYVFCETNNIPNCFNDKKNIAGRRWLNGFLKRNPEVSVRRAQLLNPARAQKLNKFIVQNHFEAIKKIYDELDISNHPERLYNIDEKGCRLTLHHQQKVLAQKGAKRVHFVAQEHAENVTIAMCVNATGNAIPPMLCFKGKRLKPEFTDNLPAGSLVKMAPKGSMTTELFIDFIAHFAKYKSPGRCLLVFDGASSHLDVRILEAADEQNIVLYCLPSNTTHELQPLDKSVNKSYEHFWDEEVLLYAYQNPELKLTKSRFNKIFSKVWGKCASQENIVNGFRATGLYPFNPKAIPEEAYAPSFLTERPHSQAQNISSLNHPVSPGHVYNADTDATDCEDNPRTLSPSLLYDDVISEDIAQERGITKFQSHVGRLVDYDSSSSESTPENISDLLSRQPLADMCDRDIQFRSPIPSTSGLNIQRQPLLNSSLSDFSDEDDFESNAFQKCFQYPARSIRIYTSSSSDSENIAPQSRENVSSGPTDSDDNIPLSKMKQTPEINTSFQKLIPTPNYATVKNKPRRKALNYMGQRITKDLFDVTKNKPQKKTQQEAENSDKPTPKRKKEGKNVETKKAHEKVKKLANKKQQKVNKKKNTSENNPSTISKDVWYCEACKTERIADMRECKKCLVWYHEECVGLTKEDTDQFVCPNCN